MTRFLQAIAVLVALGLAGPAFGEVKADKIVIVTAKKTGLNQVPRNVIKDLFLGKTTSYRDVTLVPITPDQTSAIYREFITAVLGMSPADDTAYWEQAKREHRTRPLSITNSKVLQRFLLSRAGVVTFMYASEVASLEAFVVRLDEI